MDELPYLTLKQLPIWPSVEVMTETMPACFKDQYPNTRVIIDCTELFMQVPSSFRAQSHTYSLYKSHNIAIGLIGIAPNGFVSFISNLYGGISLIKTLQRCVASLTSLSLVIWLWQIEASIYIF